MYKSSTCNFPFELGLCCINNTLRHPDKNIPKKNRPREVFPNRTCTRDRFSVSRAKTLALQNIQDMTEMLYWNHSHQIHHYRISSDMFPHYTDPETELYTMDFALDALEEAGRVARSLNQRITAHPGQFVQIGAKDPQIFQKSYEDLQMHTDIMNAMNIPENEGILCIHGGGVYGDKENTIRRWIDQFDDLPREIQNRLAIEHCEKCYSLQDALTISNATGIPVIFDNLHYDCYAKLHPNETIASPEDLLPEVVERWKSRECSPVFHLAQQKEKERTGAHADFVDEIPSYLFDLARNEDTIIHLEVEAKSKEAAIFRLKEKYKV